jgi:hypothetical protein
LTPCDLADPVDPVVLPVAPLCFLLLPAPPAELRRMLAPTLLIKAAADLPIDLLDPCESFPPFCCCCW